MINRNPLQQIITLLSALILLAGCGVNATAAPTAAPQVMVLVVTATPPAVPTAAPTAPAAPAAPVDTFTGQVNDLGPIQFKPNTTGWNTQGDLPANSAIRFSLNAKRGQQMNIWLNKSNRPQLDMSAALYITGADGTIFTPNPVTFFSQVLPTSQNYFIEIRSMIPDAGTYAINVDIPAEVIDPALGDKYEPVDPSVCQILQEAAAGATGLEFYRDDVAPFLDTIGGEAGKGCHIFAVTDGAHISDPNAALQTLMGSAGAGWTEQPGYQAGGPTGAATAMVRDMALMKINVLWEPDRIVACPAGQPISACPLTPEQKIYALSIDAAQYRSNISLDGHWEDTAANFSLDLGQDWKNIFGHHTVVAQNGSKIDSLDISISGLLQGDVANVEFHSSFTDSVGTATITYIDPNTIHWNIVKPPDGEFYLPAEATLVRK
jgi:hypothetical protein